MTGQDRAVFVSVYVNKELYAACVTENPFVKNMQNCDIVGFDNTIDNQYLSKRYNQFLNDYDYRSPAWFVFCHSDWELREDLGAVLRDLDHDCLYGPIGAIAYSKADGTLVHELRGQCFEKKRDGTNERRLLSLVHDTGVLVDTFDCQCLIVHSDLVSEYALRFDENLAFDLYVEDFCIAAQKSYGIQSKIVSVRCCHWSQVISPQRLEAYDAQLGYFNTKYPDSVYAGTVSLIGGKMIADKVEMVTEVRLYVHFIDRLTHLRDLLRYFYRRLRKFA